MSTALRGLLTNRCWLSTEVISLLSLNECAQFPSGAAGLSHAARGDAVALLPGARDAAGSREGQSLRPQGGTSVSASRAWTPSRPLVEPAGEGLLCSRGPPGQHCETPSLFLMALSDSWFFVTHSPHHTDVSPGVNYLPIFPRVHLLRLEADPPVTPGFP